MSLQCRLLSAAVEVQGRIYLNVMAGTENVVAAPPSAPHLAVAGGKHSAQDVNHVLLTRRHSSKALERAPECAFSGCFDATNMPTAAR